MSFAFEAPPDLEIGSGTQHVNYFDRESYEEEDYRSLGIDPATATVAKPGSEEKVLMLAARYAAGLPLWHNSDCYDHGPGASLPPDSDLEVAGVDVVSWSLIS